MHSRPHLFLLSLLILLAMALPAQAAAESEPNNTPAQAIPIGVGYANAVVNAVLETDDDMDYYRLDAQAGRTYVIEAFNVQKLPSWYASAVLELYASNGTTMLAEDWTAYDGTGETAARMVYTFPLAGSAYIKVASRNSWAGAYSLRVLAKYDEPGAAWSAANGMESNDVRALAVPLGLGPAHAQQHTLAALSASIRVTDDDIDFFHFTGQAGHTYTVELFNIGDSGSGPGLWAFEGNSDSVLKGDPWADNGEGTVWARVTFVAPSSTIYFVRVGNPMFTHWTGSYAIRACEDACLGRLFVPIARR